MTNSQTSKPALRPRSHDRPFCGRSLDLVHYLVIGTCSLVIASCLVLDHLLLHQARRSPANATMPPKLCSIRPPRTSHAFRHRGLPEREKLLDQAARNYQLLLRRYPDQTNWCAQALRHLGNIRARKRISTRRCGISPPWRRNIRARNGNHSGLENLPPICSGNQPAK